MRSGSSPGPSRTSSTRAVAPTRSRSSPPVSCSASSWCCASKTGARCRCRTRCSSCSRRRSACASTRSRSSARSWSRSCCASPTAAACWRLDDLRACAWRSRPRPTPRTKARGISVGQREKVAPVLIALAAAAAAQLLVDVTASKLLRLGASFSAARPARVAGDRVVGHADGDRLPGRRRQRAGRHLGAVAVLHAAARGLVRIRTARLGDPFVPPDDRGPRDGARARAAWCRPATPSGSRRSRRRWASCSGCPTPRCATSRWRRCCTISARSRSTIPSTSAAPIRAEVTAVTGAMLREIRPLVAAGEIVAGDVEDPHAATRGAGAAPGERVRRPDRPRLTFPAISRSSRYGPRRPTCTTSGSWSRWSERCTTGSAPVRDAAPGR